jgi:hypothetical protein
VKRRASILNHFSPQNIGLNPIILYVRPVQCGTNACSVGALGPNAEGHTKRISSRRGQRGSGPDCEHSGQRSTAQVCVGRCYFSSVVFALVIPYAPLQVGRIDPYIPVVQSIICVTEFITAVLLFAQYSIQPQRAILALASGYICSGLFAFLHTLEFPGAYSTEWTVLRSGRSPCGGKRTGGG